MPAGDLVIRDPRALRALAAPGPDRDPGAPPGRGPGDGDDDRRGRRDQPLGGLVPPALARAVRARRRCRRRLGPQSALAGGAEPDSCSSPPTMWARRAEAAVQLLSAQLVARGEQETLAFIAARRVARPRLAGGEPPRERDAAADGGRAGRGRASDRRGRRAVPARLPRRRPRGRAPGAVPAPALPPRRGGAGTVTRGRAPRSTACSRPTRSRSRATG